MARKMLRCGAVVPGCDYVVHGDDALDVLAKTADHVRMAHGVQRMSDNLRDRIKAAISEDRRAEMRPEEHRPGGPPAAEHHRAG